MPTLGLLHFVLSAAIVARAKRAEAQQRIQETMSGMSDKSAFESFEHRVEETIDLGDRVLCHLTFRACTSDGGVELHLRDRRGG